MKADIQLAPFFNQTGRVASLVVGQPKDGVEAQVWVRVPHRLNRLAPATVKSPMTILRAALIK